MAIRLERKMRPSEVFSVHLAKMVAVRALEASRASERCERALRRLTNSLSLLNGTGFVR